MVDELGMRVRRRGHITCAVNVCRKGGADGLIVEYSDIAIVRDLDATLPLLVYSQKGVANYAEFMRLEERDKPGITAILAAGATHVIFDSAFVAGGDVEWAADMISKELKTVEPKHAKPRNDLLGKTCSHV